jgi:hypothetical protein
MRIKLIVSLLILCLAFSFGFAQAQDDENNNQSMTQDSSQQGNLSTEGNMTENQTGNMTSDISNVSLMLQDIQGIRNNDTTGEKWLIFINGEEAEEDFGKNNVIEGDRLSFWYTTENEDQEEDIKDATFAAHITIARANQTQDMTGMENQTQNTTGMENQTQNMTGMENQTQNMTGMENQTQNMTGMENQTQNMTGMENQTGGPTVLYDNTVNLTEGVFIFTPENSTQSYQANNFTDIGALNATGLQYNVSVMQDDMDEEDQNDNDGE